MADRPGASLPPKLPGELPGGLRLIPRDWGAAAKAILASVIGVSAFVLLIDGLLFRGALTPGYVAFFTSPLIPRVPAVCLMAVMEEIKFRLLLMTALVFLATRVRKEPPAAWFAAIIIVTQFADAWGPVLADPLYAGLRFWAVGCIWGWLYWRHGWISAVIGHGTVHLLLDPLLLAVL